MGENGSTVSFVTVRRGEPNFARGLISRTERESLLESRGTVDEDGTVRSRCSTRFLQSVCLQIMRARAFPYTKILEDLDKEQQLKRLQTVKHELARLIKFPGLFPSPATRGRFFAILALDSELSFTAAYKDLLVDSELRLYDQAWQEQITRPTFLEGSQPWENFLLNAAPGLSVAPLETAPKSSCQVLPAVATRVIADFEKEESSIVNWVRNGDMGINLNPAASTLMVNFDNPHPDSEHWPDVRMYFFGHSGSTRETPCRDHKKIHCDLVRPGPEPLQSLPIVAHRLEHRVNLLPGAVAALNTPNFFLSTTLRTLHPPFEKARNFVFSKNKMQKWDQSSTTRTLPDMVI